jgi:hypothetical protein
VEDFPGLYTAKFNEKKRSEERKFYTELKAYHQCNPIACKCSCERYKCNGIYERSEASHGGSVGVDAM